MLINGDFIVAQRGTAFTAATTPANSDDTYLLDRWVLLSDGNDIVDVDQETSTIPEGSRSAMKFTIATADKKWGILQVIENKSCVHLLQTSVPYSRVSLSFKARRGTGHTTPTKIRAGVLAWSDAADTVTSDIVDAWGAEGTNPTAVANWTFENTITGPH
jgi:hypothetical protein